jgi:2-octaprenyl-6-methoxyphenol hydroxylase
MKPESIAIVGAGPVGLTLALLLARRQVASTVFDARSLADAARDRRLLALSRGSLELLRSLVELPTSALAPIRSVLVTSAGEFGRVEIDDDDLDGEPLGATVRYGELLTTLDGAARSQPLIELRRGCRVESLRQANERVDVELAEGAPIAASVAVNAEGLVGARVDGAAHSALVADVEVSRLPPARAVERFTREGPLALLPLPGGAGPKRRMALVWCMATAAAQRRLMIGDTDLLKELQQALAARGTQVHAIANRACYPLTEQVRGTLREHRIVYLGNAAQTLHPVAGQGLNLGLRDCKILADCVAEAHAAGEDPVGRLPDYERARRADRSAIVALTRTVPALFATSFIPVAAARSLGLTLLSAFPNLRRDFARLLMFGVR